jgi:hypothetical protein
VLRFTERHVYRWLARFDPVDEPIEALEGALTKGIEARIDHRGAILGIVRNLYK